MQLLRALLVDGDDVHRRRMTIMLQDRHIECLEAADLGNAPRPLSRNGIDLIVAEAGSVEHRAGPSLEQMIEEDVPARALPVIIYLNPFQEGAVQRMAATPAGAILIPAPVLASDLDAALERAFAIWGPSAN